VSATIFFAFAVLALAASLYFRAAERRRGTVVYTDTDARLPGATLVSRRYGLIGRPDYVIRTKDVVCPVEFTSRSSGRRGPYPGDMAQLFSYCLLVEEVTG